MIERPCPPERAAGFTLIELMVVVAVIALAGQLVVANLAALVPSTLLNGEARRLMGQIEYLRSESQLQGKPFKIEFDLDHHRYRIGLPPEERLVSEQTIEESVSLGWTDLDERVQLAGFGILGGQTQRSGRAFLQLDHNGFTGDHVIFLRMKSEALEKMVWTVQLRGLDRKSTLITSQDGTEAHLEPVEEFNFR